MRPDTRCEEVRALAPELALDLVGGHERDAAIRHVAGCASCRGEVAGFSAVADELLLHAPAVDPPTGFRARTLARLEEPEPRRRWIRPSLVAASIVLAFSLGLGVAYRATIGDRVLADSYRGILSEGNGSFFTVGALRGEEGEVGVAWGYQGDPSWVFASVGDPVSHAGWYRVSVVTVDGRVIGVDRAWFDERHPGWGTAIPVDLLDVRGVRFDGEDGASSFSVSFDPASPWTAR